MKKKISKKKKKEDKEKKESEIEEEIEEAEKEIVLEEIKEEKNIDERSIREFLPLIETKAPILERIAIQETPAFNQSRTEQEETTRETKPDYTTSNEPKYSTGREIEQEERKYETTFIPPVLTRREISGSREDFFMPKEDTWGEVRAINETPQEFETMHDEKRRLPFEEEQKKYKRIKF